MNRAFFERWFRLSEYATNVRTEMTAGLTTFLTMAYIVVVNPGILSLSGMDAGAVFVATCLSAAIGCLMMGLVANYPIALAPGMGLNAYFTFAVCKGMGVPWQIALAAVFVSGILFLALSLWKVREAIVNALPMSLKHAITAGIGLFLALIALKNAGVVVANEATLVSLGNLHSPSVLLALAGFILVVVLDYYRVRGAIILSIILISALSIALGVSPFKGIIGPVPGLAPTLMQLDFKDLFTANMIGVIFVFFFVDLFDSTGTLVGVAHRAGLLVEGKLPRLKRALLADSTAIVAGSMLGTSSTTPYIESAAGVAAGGRTGLTAVVTGVLFLLALFFSPLAASVPAFATTPALLFVGILMARSLAEIDWNDLTEAAPAFVTAVFMPFSYSIADGIAMGFIAYALVKLLCRRHRDVPYMVWIIAALWALKFMLMGG